MNHTLILSFALIATPAFGQTMYKCPNAAGVVNFQQMPCSLQGGGETVPVKAIPAGAGPSARTLFIGLNWEWPAAASPVEIDASLFLLDAAGVVRDDRDFVFYNQETDPSGAVYRLPAADSRRAGWTRW